MYSHPALPLILIGTEDGRVLTIFVQQSPNDDAKGDPENISEKSGETMSEKRLKMVGERILNRGHEIVLATHDQSDGGCNFLFLSDDNYMFLSDGRPVLSGSDPTDFLQVIAGLKVDNQILDLTVGQDLVMTLESEIPGEDSTGKAMVYKVNKASGDMILLNELDLPSFCSGIAFCGANRWFAVFMDDEKSVAKFELNRGGESVSKLGPSLRTEHGFGARTVFYELGDKQIIVAGCDGLVSYVDGEEVSKTIHIFHPQCGGIRKMSSARNGQVLAFDECGSVHLFKPDLTTESVVWEPNDLNRDFLGLLEQKGEEIEIRSGEDRVSWACRKAEERVAKERETYQGEIEDIEASLAAIREQVGQLLESNDHLPPEESLDRREFELNSEEKLRRVQGGREQEADLQLELRAWQMARYRTGQRLRRQVWDDLEVKGQAIQVRNVPKIIEIRVRNIWNHYSLSCVYIPAVEHLSLS